MEVFRTGEGTDFIRECVRVAMQELIDAEATAAIGAGRYERTDGAGRPSATGRVRGC
jgi:putative transposase